MASYDIPIISETAISDTEYFRTVVQKRRGLIIDHLVDLQARKGALALRLNETTYNPVPTALVKDITRVS